MEKVMNCFYLSVWLFKLLKYSLTLLLFVNLAVYSRSVHVWKACGNAVTGLKDWVETVLKNHYGHLHWDVSNKYTQVNQGVLPPCAP